MNSYRFFGIKIYRCNSFYLSCDPNATKEYLSSFVKPEVKINLFNNRIQENKPNFTTAVLN